MGVADERSPRGTTSGVGSDASEGTGSLWHFSEDPAIRHFRPHVAPTAQQPDELVWALDHDHAPLYWFPRQCPRVAFWTPAQPTGPVDRALLGATGAARVHAVESGWLDRIRACELWSYRFAPDDFEPWPEAEGHWVSRGTVEPIEVRPVGDLLDRHAEAGIELRITPTLWPLRDAVVSSGLSFSLVRMHNALPRRRAEEQP